MDFVCSRDSLVILNFPVARLAFDLSILPRFSAEYPGILVDGQVSPHIKLRTRLARSAVCVTLSRTLHRADVRRATAAAAMQHARAFKVNVRTARRQRSSATMRNPRNFVRRSTVAVTLGTRKRNENSFDNNWFLIVVSTTTPILRAACFHLLNIVVCNKRYLKNYVRNLQAINGRKCTSK